MTDFERQKEYERKRIHKFVDEMIDHIYSADEEAEVPEDLRIDTFGIVSTYLWTDEDGDELEGVAVYTETKRHTYARGLIERGLDRLKGATQVLGHGDGNAW